jgi:hypothetical protein
MSAADLPGMAELRLVREQAERCRRLAAGIMDDTAAERLRRLAEDYSRREQDLKSKMALACSPVAERR